MILTLKKVYNLSPLSLLRAIKCDLKKSLYIFLCIYFFKCVTASLSQLLRIGARHLPPSYCYDIGFSTQCVCSCLKIICLIL